VALDYGFSDHANFTRAFKEAYDLTPEEYRMNPVILNQFIKPDLKLNYTTVEEDIPLIADGIVVEVTRRKLKEQRTFIGIAGEVPEIELTGGKATGIATTGRIWEEFHRKKPNILTLLPQGNELGVLSMGNARAGCCTYLAGAETIDEEPVEGYSSYKLPCGEYAVCCFEAESFKELIGSAIFKAAVFMESWMKKQGLTCGNFAAEMYYGTTPEANYMELWLPLRLSQKIQIMQKKRDKTSRTQMPSMVTISSIVNNPLFDHLC
jgi:AraC family transcriptional regulator